MARYISTTFGNIKGKHGTAVSQVRNGKVILRVYNPPANPNTPKQLAQRLKFGLVASSLNPLRSVINFGYGSNDGYNAASSIALRKAIKGEYPEFTLDYSQVMVASGTLPLAFNITLVAQADANVYLTWDTTVWTKGSDNDLVHVAFLNPLTGITYFAEGRTTRETGALTLQLPLLWKGETIHAWLFLISPDNEQRSVSQYLGTIVPV